MAKKTSLSNEKLMYLAAAIVLIIIFMFFSVNALASYY